jgi:DNA-binding LacI/PurR family transcriptional regulator
MPTVSQTAQHAGVAKSTVSLVLNKKSGVSEQTRQIVLNAYQELRSREESRELLGKWQATESESPARGESSKPMSLVVFHPAILRSSQVFTELLEGIQDGAANHQAQIRLAVNESNLPLDHIANLYLKNPALRPSGILMIGAHQEESILMEADRQGIPYVLVSRTTDNLTISAVGRNEESVACQAVNYLLDLGHKVIGFVGGDPTYNYTNQRIKGYTQALKARGITPLERWVSLGAGDQAAQAILQTCPEISAVVFVNDSYAMEGLPVFINAGRRIPETLSVISFDDTAEAQSYHPPLTSVHSPRYAEGVWAVRSLMEKIRNPLVESFQVILKQSLIIRESCSPLQKSEV